MQYFGGVSKCFCELIANLPEGVEAQISIVQSDNQHLWESGLVEGLLHVTIDHKQWNKRFPGKLMDVLYLAANKYLPLPTADSQNRRITNWNLSRGDFDLFHPTYFKPEFLRYLGKKPFVLTVHDMMPELYPEYYGTNYPDLAWKRQLVKRANAIVAVSENTKADLVRILGVPEEKITVIYHGGPVVNTASEAPRLVASRYLLYVGQRIFYKNFVPLLDAFQKAQQREEMADVKLVFTGAPFTAEEQQLLAERSLLDHVLQLHPTDAQMQTLYRDALAFVYPSAYEGFGMPILEAFANGCPVLLNRASCFPEVGGDAARYFSFEQGTDQLTGLLIDVATDNADTRAAWAAKGAERLQQFSWKKSAQQLANLYQSLI